MEAKENLKISLNPEVSSVRGSLAELHWVGTAPGAVLSSPVYGTALVLGSVWSQQAVHVALTPQCRSRGPHRGPEGHRVPFPGNPGKDP